MREFLSNNRDELLRRCRVKVAQRRSRDATPEQLERGLPLFFDQLVSTLAAEERGDAAGGQLISGAPGGEGSESTAMGVTAAAHGADLLALGYEVDQVVHDYGDLCQAITDLAVEHDAPFSIEAYRTLNRCLDNAIAGAVTEFAELRGARAAQIQAEAENERIGSLAHELRNYLQVAKLAFAALESGTLPVGGSTGAVLKRSLSSLTALVDAALDVARENARASASPQVFALAPFLADAARIAALYASGSGSALRVEEVDPLLAIGGSRELLSSALVNLLSNAFKFTHSCSEVTLRAKVSDRWVDIEVEDCCGGLPAGSVEALFAPFRQGFEDRRGLGLGLSIARRSVEADGGRLTARDLPGKGCVFTIGLPLRKAAQPGARPVGEL